MAKSCVITGDKPTRFKFGYKEDYSLCKKLKRTMKEQIMTLYDKGVTCFFVGGSLGVDIWAGEIILRLKEQHGYEGIELVVVVPYKGHDINWDERSQKRLNFLIKHSKEYIIAGDRNCQESYWKRNRYMVDQVDYFMAVCDMGMEKPTDIGKMLSYARKRKRHIILIHPDTTEICS